MMMSDPAKNVYKSWWFHNDNFSLSTDRYTEKTKTQKGSNKGERRDEK